MRELVLRVVLSPMISHDVLGRPSLANVCIYICGNYLARVNVCYP